MRDTTALDVRPAHTVETARHGTLNAPAAVRPDRSRLSGATVKRYCDVDAAMQAQAVLVTIHLGPSVVLTQARYGRVHCARISRGEITITGPGEQKEWHHSEPSSALCLWLSPAWEEIAIEDSASFRGPIRILDNFGTRDPQIEQIGYLFLAESESKGLGERIYVDSLGVALSVHLLRRYSTLHGYLAAHDDALPPFKLHRAIEYINEHLAENITLPQIAGVLNMSLFHFARGFKRSTGKTPHQYLMECRIERAKLLLRETDLPITEIAYQTGCATQSHFSVLFHHATSTTPRTYRQRR
jgi:AraC family transcriptional regulator